MGNNKPLQNLEYKVLFDDGLRPNVFVYGIDSAEGTMYYTRAFIAVKIGVSYQAKTSAGKKNKKIVLTVAPDCGFATICQVFKEMIPEKENWEQGLYSLLENDQFNVIKVYSTQQMRLALDIHGQDYFETYHGLAKTFVAQFEQFISENPHHQPVPWKKRAKTATKK
ncbi:MAG: hypothetical protein Q8R37_05820 [Nanoarchaeota archaeon]|nr:hypothetical protein [Nanoarchaeota archaeon]